MTWTPALPVAGLDDGRPVEVEIGREPVLILRQGDHVHAAAALCPHKFAALVDGTVGDGCLTCPQHEATFDLRSGEADEPWAGRLPVYATRIVDGVVEVALAATSASPSP